MKNNKRKKHLTKKYVFPKLLKKIRVNIVLIFIFFLLSVYRFIEWDIQLKFFIFALFIGTVIWFLLWRMYKIHWDNNKKQVVSMIDKIGFIFLGIYILIEVWKRWIFSPIIPDMQLGAFGIILLTGLFIWRLASMMVRIKQVVREER